MSVHHDADRLLRLHCGRVIGYRIYGDPAGAPVLFLHGTPGSRLKFSIGDKAGKAMGLAIIAPDRWGYGLTDPHTTPTLPAFADDMSALMSDLGHQHFAVAAISGGAPYAVAVAACLGPRVAKLALISPVGPVTEGSRRALSPLHRFSFVMLPNFPWVIAGIFSSFRLCLAQAPRFAARLATLRNASDRALIVRPEIGEPLIVSFREGLRPGMAGPITDLALFSRPWNIPLGAIATPTQLWIGSGDRAVPLPAARALAAQIEGCVLTEMPGQGHFWLAANYVQVLAWIASSSNAARRANP